MKFTNRKDGFTMLELLAVLAIILILGAILFPAIESAREKSLTTACSQNVKQLVLAITQYEQDKGNFPAARDFYDTTATGNVATDLVLWQNAIAPYMHADPTAISGMGGTQSLVAQAILGGLPAGNADALYPEAYRCPSVSSWDKVGWNSSYGYNGDYLGDKAPKTLVTATPANRGFVNFPVRKSSIVRPDKMICVADSDGTGFNSYVSAGGIASGGVTHAVANLGAFGYYLDPTFKPARVLVPGGTIPNPPLAAPNAAANIGPAAGGIFVDATSGGITVIANATNQAYRSIVSSRHKGSANVGFLDGHVESLVREQCYFQPVPTPVAVGVTITIYPSNALWNGFGIDNDTNGDGSVTPSTGERLLDQNEAYVLANITAPNYNLNGNVLYTALVGGGPGTYGGITGLSGAYLNWGPGFDILTNAFSLAATNIGPTIPHVAPFRVEGGSIQ